MSAVDNVEQSILGMRLLASDAVDYVIRDRVRDYMFADPRNAALWRMCETLQQEAAARTRSRSQRTGSASPPSNGRASTTTTSWT